MMKKSDLKLLRANMQRALEPPSKRKPDNSDELSKLFDDGTILQGGSGQGVASVELDHQAAGSTSNYGSTSDTGTTSSKHRVDAPGDLNYQANASQLIELADLEAPLGEAEETGSTRQNGITENKGTTSIIGSTGKTSTTNYAGNTKTDGSTTYTGSTSTTTRHGNTKSTGLSRSEANIAPIRDFQRVPNSVTREAMAARLFKGKSKQVWDYLWSVSRGAVVPSRAVRKSRPQIKKGAGLGSINTVDMAIEHLCSVGLVSVSVIIGENGGNEYEVYTPEEVAAGLFGATSLDGSTGSTAQSGSTGYTQNMVVPVLPQSGSTGTTSSLGESDIYGVSNTFIKTTTNDDERTPVSALLEALDTAARELVGRLPNTPLERDRWREVGELLADELKTAANHTGTISSAPAFLAAHLRRRLKKNPQREGKSRLADIDVGRAAPPAAGPVKLTDEAIAEAASMFADMLGNGYTPESLAEQFSSGYLADDWTAIRLKLDTEHIE